MTARVRSALLGLGLLVCTLACGDAGPTAEITARRTASRPSSRVVPGATAPQRFGSPGSEAPSESSDDLIAYDLPSGWMAIAPTSDRLVNLRPAGDPEASCYLSFMAGSAGGLEANVNRWRTQFGTTPLSGDEIKALPKRAMLGRDATQVEVEGTFSGMGGTTPRAGFKLLGLVISEPSGSLFLKFTAPAGVVELERERFFDLADSLRIAKDGEAEHGPGDGHDHGAAGMGAPASRLAWVVPDGWTVQPPRPMREVSFTLVEGAECYITRLGGDAGGLRANLDRWCGQVGREPLTDAAFAALERIVMLGQNVPVLELEGAFKNMDGVERQEQGLLGVACIRGQESLFVKLTGPEKVVRAERENFRAFVRSLEEPQ